MSTDIIAERVRMILAMDISPVAKAVAIFLVVIGDNELEVAARYGGDDNRAFFRRGLQLLGYEVPATGQAD